MPQIKRFHINVKYILIVSSFFLFSCNEDRRIIDSGVSMCRPFGYPINRPKVFLFSKGELVTMSEALTDLGEFGWAYSSSSMSYVELKKMPDSIAVDYGGLNVNLQMCTFKGGVKLPTQKIQDLLEKGYTHNNEKKQFRNILVGLAPEGMVCVWLDHVELLRFKAVKVNKYSNTPLIFYGDSLSVMEYLERHPIEISIWEKPDVRYDLDFGFTSERREIDFGALYYISKEGIRNTIFKEQIDYTKWNMPYGENVDLWGVNYQQINETKKDYKLCLPVDVQIKWYDGKKIYNTKIVMPKILPQIFSRPYINPVTNRQNHFNRIIFGVEDDGEYCNVWLDGKNKQKRIMRFKGKLSTRDKKGIYSDNGIYATEVIYY